MAADNFQGRTEKASRPSVRPSNRYSAGEIEEEEEEEEEDLP